MQQWKPNVTVAAIIQDDKRFLIVETEKVYPQGTSVEAGGREVGKLGTHAGGLALALLRLDRISDADQKNVPITIAGNNVILRKPVWLQPRSNHSDKV